MTPPEYPQQGSPLHNLTPQFRLAVLGPNAMKSVQNLLHEVQDSLEDDEKHFLKPQDMSRHPGFAVGMIETSTGQIASVALITPADLAELNPNFDSYPPNLLESGAAIIHSVAVRPSFQGNSLMQLTLDGAEMVSARFGITSLIAKVARGNFKSMKNFAAADFMDAAYPSQYDTDSKLGYLVTYKQKRPDPLVTGPVPLFNVKHHDNDQPAAFKYI